MKFSSVYRVLIAFNFIFFLFVSTVAAAKLYKLEVVQTISSCGEHEVFSLCKANPLCEKSCDNIDIWEAGPCIQRKICRSGCICKEGYVRDKAWGICVWENSCARVRH